MHETPRAAAAFEEYAAMGSSRSLRKLAKQRDKSGTKAGQILKQLGKWSSDHGWQERVRQYDKERIEEKRLQREAEIEEMNARHAEVGMKQQKKAIKQIKDLIAAKAFGSVAAVQLLKLAMDLERLARGTATEQIAVTDRHGDALPVIGVYLPQKRNIEEASSQEQQTEQHESDNNE